MVKKITQEIVGFEIASEAASATEAQDVVKSVQANKAEGPRKNVIHMHERVERPDMLLGSTYKIKTPLSDHALYVTVNDIILNAGTEHEQRRPFEMFINSKNMDHFQWIVALTRIISAVFRKGGDINFLVEELRSVFDPSGGYFKKGGKFMPSLVAEIGDVMENHLRMIGMLVGNEPERHQQELIDEKRSEYEKRTRNHGSGATQSPYINAVLCKQCHHQAMVKIDGCMTCLNCGESKCG